MHESVVSFWIKKKKGKPEKIQVKFEFILFLGPNQHELICLSLVLFVLYIYIRIRFKIHESVSFLFWIKKKRKKVKLQKILPLCTWIDLLSTICLFGKQQWCSLCLALIRFDIYFHCNCFMRWGLRNGMLENDTYSRSFVWVRFNWVYKMVVEGAIGWWYYQNVVVIIPLCQYFRFFFFLIIVFKAFDKSKINIFVLKVCFWWNWWRILELGSRSCIFSLHTE